MIDSRITRKITTACKHDLPVVVSCLECMEAELRQWEARIRNDYKHTIMDEYRFMEDQVKTAREQTVGLQDSNDRLARAVTQLQSENKRLRTEAKELQSRIDNTSAQLHAEQTAKVKYPILVEDAG